MGNDRSDQQDQPGSFNHLNKIERRDVVLGGGALLTATALAGARPPNAYYHSAGHRRGRGQ